MPIDFGRHSDDYATFRPGFPDSFYDRLDRLAELNGRRVLDIATGPGVIAFELARRGCAVTGTDISAQQIEAAISRAGLRDVAFKVEPAEQTSFDNDTFDMVTAGQCWHWFDQVRVLHEIRRVLRPKGHLVIGYYSYLAKLSPIVSATESLVLSLNPQWDMANSDGMYPQIVDQVCLNGFQLVEQFCTHHSEPFSHERWRGRMRTCNGVGSGGMAPETVAAFDHQLAIMLEPFPEPMDIPHRLWCIVAQKT
ncbi:MAG: class I SAM-dependent methyltransferase [Acidobacteria bacterium]|nr:class I SAM-dependent methyltransferase [Acidobacteriota bacterium]